MSLCSALLIVLCVAATGSAQYAYTLTRDNAVMKLDLRAARATIGSWQYSEVASVVRWSPDGTQIAVGGHFRVMEVFDANTGQVVGWGPPGQGAYFFIGVAWTPDSQYLLGGGGSHRVFMTWRGSNYRDGGPRPRGFSPGEVWFEDMEVDPQGVFVAVCEKASKVVIYNLTDVSEKGGDFPNTGPPVLAKDLPVYGAYGNQCRQVAWTPDGMYVLSASKDGVRLWQVRQSPNSDVLVNDGTLTAYPHSATGASFWATRPVYGLKLISYFFDSDGNPLTGTDCCQTLSVHVHRSQRWVVMGQGRSTFRGKYSAADMKTVAIADLSNLNQPAVIIDTFSRRCYAARFSPNGAWLATGGRQEVRVWAVSGTPDQWTRHMVVTGFSPGDETRDVNSIDWSPDSSKFVVCVGGEKINKDGAPNALPPDTTEPTVNDPNCYIFAVDPNAPQPSYQIPPTPMPTSAASITPTKSPTKSGSNSRTPTKSTSHSRSSTKSMSITRTSTRSVGASYSPSTSRLTDSPSETRTPTGSGSETRSETRTQTPSRTASPTPTPDPDISEDPFLPPDSESPTASVSESPMVAPPADAVTAAADSPDQQKVIGGAVGGTLGFLALLVLLVVIVALCRKRGKCGGKGAKGGKKKAPSLGSSSSSSSSSMTSSTSDPTAKTTATTTAVAGKPAGTAATATTASSASSTTDAAATAAPTAAAPAAAKGVRAKASTCSSSSS